MLTLKSKTITLLTTLFLLSFYQISSAQQAGVDDLVKQYGDLLKPSAEESNSTLQYTQAYLELKKKVDRLSPENRTAFENGINKYSSDPDYANLHAMLFDEGGQSTTLDSTTYKNSASAGVANTSTVDSTIQMQVFDRRHKAIQSMVLKPQELQDKIASDGYHVSVSSYDFTTKKATVTLAKTDASGTTAKVTFLATGECDMKCKLDNGRMLTVHSGADVNPTIQLSSGKKK
jgi:hypothetical protein